MTGRGTRRAWLLYEPGHVEAVIEVQASAWLVDERDEFARLSEAYGQIQDGGTETSGRRALAERQEKRLKE